MYSTGNINKKGSFPDPLAERADKSSEEYGLQYAKAIHSQWGKQSDSTSLIAKRNKTFERTRDYAWRRLHSLRQCDNWSMKEFCMPCKI